MFTRHPLKYFYETRVYYESNIKLNKKIINLTPKLKKIVLNFGSKKLNTNYLIDLFGVLLLITKQKPIITRSKKAIINLKIKKNQIVSFKVTLRRYNLFEFLLRFIAVVMPKYPFLTLYNFGFKEGAISFKYDKVPFFDETEIDSTYINNNIFPDLNINIHTTAKTKYECLVLLRYLQFPVKAIN